MFSRHHAERREPGGGASFIGPRFTKLSRHRARQSEFICSGRRAAFEYPEKRGWETLLAPDISPGRAASPIIRQDQAVILVHLGKVHRCL